MSGLRALLIALSIVVLGLAVPSRGDAGHVAPHQCGVQSSSFARTCRPQAHGTCLRAAERGVAGITKALCDQQKAACSRCLGEIRVCISRIGHWPALTHSCGACKARFDTCYAIYYPKS